MEREKEKKSPNKGNTRTKEEPTKKQTEGKKRQRKETETKRKNEKEKNGEIKGEKEQNTIIIRFMF